jgi:hypothetical protein
VATSKTFAEVQRIARAVPEELKDRAIGLVMKTAFVENPEAWLRPLSPEEVAATLCISPEALKLRRFRGTADHPPLWEETLAPDGTPREAAPGRKVLYCDRITLLRWIAGENVRLVKPGAAA